MSFRIAALFAPMALLAASCASAGATPTPASQQDLGAVEIVERVREAMTAAATYRVRGSIVTLAGDVYQARSLDGEQARPGLWRVSLAPGTGQPPADESVLADGVSYSRYAVAFESGARLSEWRTDGPYPEESHPFLDWLPSAEVAAGLSVLDYPGRPNAFEWQVTGTHRDQLTAEQAERGVDPPQTTYDLLIDRTSSRLLRFDMHQVLPPLDEGEQPRLIYLSVDYRDFDAPVDIEIPQVAEG